jgi:hypothetical protein
VEGGGEGYLSPIPRAGTVAEPVIPRPWQCSAQRPHTETETQIETRHPQTQHAQTYTTHTRSRCAPEVPGAKARTVQTHHSTPATTIPSFTIRLGTLRNTSFEFKLTDGWLGSRPKGWVPNQQWPGASQKTRFRICTRGWIR